MNSTFCAHWLASSEVISQVLLTYEQPKKNKMAFASIVSQIKLLFGLLGIQLVWYILKQLFTSVLVKVVDIFLAGEVNIHHYSPSLWWIIVKYKVGCILLSMCSFPALCSLQSLYTWQIKILNFLLVPPYYLLEPVIVHLSHVKLESAVQDLLCYECCLAKLRRPLANLRKAHQQVITCVINSNKIQNKA